MVVVFIIYGDSGLRGFVLLVLLVLCGGASETTKLLLLLRLLLLHVHVAKWRSKVALLILQVPLLPLDSSHPISAS